MKFLRGQIHRKGPSSCTWTRKISQHTVQGGKCWNNEKPPDKILYHREDKYNTIMPIRPFISISNNEKLPAGNKSTKHNVTWIDTRAGNITKKFSEPHHKDNQSWIKETITELDFIHGPPHITHHLYLKRLV